MSKFVMWFGICLTSAAFGTAALAEEPTMLRGSLAPSSPNTQTGQRSLNAHGGTEGQTHNDTADSHQNPLGLRGTVASTLSNSLELKASRNDAEAAHLEIRRARAAFMPTITGRASANQSENLRGLQVSRPGKQTGYAVEVSMPLFTSGRNYYRLLGTKNAARSADLRYMNTELQTAFKGAEDYLDVHLNREIESAIQRNIGSMSKIVRSLRHRRRAGLVGRTDLAIGNSELQLLRTELARAEGARRASEITYQSLTGKVAPVKTEFPNTAPFALPSEEIAVRRAQSLNPEILAAHHDAKAASHNANSTLGSFLPQVNLTGRYGEDFYHGSGIRDTESWQIGAELTIPIFNGDAIPAVQQSKKQASAARYRALDVRRNVERTIRATWSTYEAEKSRAQAVGGQIAELKIAVRGTRKEFEAGLRSITDVLNRQIALTRAEIEFARAKAAEAVSIFQIAAQAGTLEIEYFHL